MTRFHRVEVENCDIKAGIQLSQAPNGLLR